MESSSDDGLVWNLRVGWDHNDPIADMVEFFLHLVQPLAILDYNPVTDAHILVDYGSSDLAIATDPYGRP